MKVIDNLTVIFDEDAKGRGFSAHFAEMPNIASQGPSKDEAAKLLFNLLPAALKSLRERATKGVKKENTRFFELSVSE